MSHLTMIDLALANSAVSLHIVSTASGPLAHYQHWCIVDLHEHVPTEKYVELLHIANYRFQSFDIISA